MGIALEYEEGQTPISEEEKEGLLITNITTKAELDEFEQANIQQAIEWTLGRKWRADKILTENFIRLLHKKMYGEVWAWAGNFRRSDKNIGVIQDRNRIKIPVG